MSDAAIKRALEVAAQGLEGSAAAGQWLAEPEELAATAIAAFLEALPADRVLMPSTCGTMAAAVRRAAGGE